MTQEHPTPISQDTATFQETHTPEKQGLLARMTNGLFSFLDAPARWIDELLYKMQHIPETNFVIGQRMTEAGHYTDAILRLRITLWLAPNHQQAHYLLGCCYLSLGEMDKALAPLRKAVQLNPQDEEAVFMLCTLKPDALPPEQQPTTMPARIAHDYFSSRADGYETAQLDSGYRGHLLADEAVWDALDRRRTNYTVLELGCGSGLCGVLLAEHAEEITGVDFCHEMLDLAKYKRRPDNRRVYTEAVYQDIRHYVMDLRKPQFDAIVAAHVFNYVGDISQVIAGAARGLRPGGVFVFQVERFGEEGRFGLIPGLGRFGHSDGYVRHYIQQAGLELIANDLVNLYPDYQIVQYVARMPETE